MADKLVARAKILLGFYQVMGEMFSALDEIQWPDVLKQFGSVLQVLQADVMRIIISPRCYFPNFTYPNVYIEFIFGLAFVAFVLCAALCYYSFSKCYHVAKETPVFEMTESLVKAKQRCCLFVVMLLFVCYPNLSSVIFTLLPSGCDMFYLDESQTFATRRLRSDYSIDCGMAEHVHFTHAAEAALGFVIGFPVMLFVLLWWSNRRGKTLSQYALISNSGKNGNTTSSTISMCCEDQGLLGSAWQIQDYGINTEPNRRSMDDPSTPGDVSVTGTDHNTSREPTHERVSWKSFLCENYKPQFWYWEIVELARKIVQTLFVLLFGYEDPFTMFSTIVISVVFFLVHSSVRPMKDDTEHRLQLFSLGTIFLNLLVASLLLLPANEDLSGEQRKEVLAVALGLLNLSLIAIVLCTYSSPPVQFL